MKKLAPLMLVMAALAGSACASAPLREEYLDDEDELYQPLYQEQRAAHPGYRHSARPYWNPSRR